jgi:hypothetical protein
MVAEKVERGAMRSVNKQSRARIAKEAVNVIAPCRNFVETDWPQPPEERTFPVMVEVLAEYHPTFKQSLNIRSRSVFSALHFASESEAFILLPA